MASLLVVAPLLSLLSDLDGSLVRCSSDSCGIEIANVNTFVFRVSDVIDDINFITKEERKKARAVAEKLCSLRFSGYSLEFQAEAKKAVRNGSYVLAKVQTWPSGNGLTYACPFFEP